MRSDVVTTDGNLVVRRMRDDDADYERMVYWRNLPHVRYRWDPDLPPLTLESAREEYRADTLPDGLTTACIIELQGNAIGFIQFYRWSSYAEAAMEVGIPFDDLSYGLDVFIGELDQIGRGVGTRVVRLLSDHLFDERGASSVALTTEVGNYAAIKCYENAGFSKVREVLDSDTREGERLRCWLMVRERKS